MRPRLAPALAIALLSIGPTMSADFYATTPACDLVTESEASALTGAAMTQKGGAFDPEVSDCIWDGAGRVRLELSLNEAALYAASGQTSADEFERMIEVTTRDGHPPELIDGVGERAALHRSDDGAALFLTVVGGGGYLSLMLTGSTRAAIIALGKTAASHMMAAK